MYQTLFALSIANKETEEASLFTHCRPSWNVFVCVCVCKHGSSTLDLTMVNRTDSPEFGHTIGQVMATSFIKYIQLDTREHCNPKPYPKHCPNIRFHKQLTPTDGAVAKFRFFFFGVRLLFKKTFSSKSLSHVLKNGHWGQVVWLLWFCSSL